MDDNIEQTIADLKSLLSNLSSDLQSPLSVISGYGELLLLLEQDEVILQDSFTRREALENIARSGKYVADVCKEYLDLAFATFKQEIPNKQENEISEPELTVNLRQLNANLSAEIRSPLNAVMGYADLLLMLDSYEDVDGLNRKEMLEQLRPACYKLYSLLELVFQPDLQTKDDISSTE